MLGFDMSGGSRRRRRRSTSGKRRKHSAKRSSAKRALRSTRKVLKRARALNRNLLNLISPKRGY